MKKLPIGIQSIREILEEDQVYVDKTGFAKNLLDFGKHYFISRPRRFGKSLFINTLEEILKGNRELFKGCQIYHSNYDWEKYPVLFFDFSRIESRSPDDFEDALKRNLQATALARGISMTVPTIQEGLETLIVGLSQSNRVAVLVDEYDSPIINHLKNAEVAQANRDLLKIFFTTLKSFDRYLKFTFVTGVSKFSQVSLFSGPNNLTDITMNPKYAAMMGYTEKELKHSFSDYIEHLTKREKMAKAVLLEIRNWYNGYRFSEEELSVYNPYSTLRFFGEGRVKSYWYSTGTPSFLVDEIKKRPQSILSLKGAKALEISLSDISRLDRISLPALMFQTGYLTISDYTPDEAIYSLDFPNREVRQAFFDSLVQEFTEINPVEISRKGKEIKEDLETYDLRAFIAKINAHFAKISYQVFAKAHEGFYQAVFFTFLEKSGITTATEMATNSGRIDLVCEMESMICIFELKLDKTADCALTQVEAKKYRERFSTSEKPILVVGINFSSSSRNISSWKGALFSPKGECVKEIL